ncbi:MAG TPA: ParB/RepB/Spo0J family partition protein [Isosphaeraceae bacterium]|nr:ParB/RepB/Spo0J family partition protein [Isosphaeraceae bacterium]
MGKLDDLRKLGGGNVLESTSRRDDSPAIASDASSLPPRREGATRSRHALEIAIERIERDPNQPREEFDAEGLQRLAESMKARGQLQPLRVRHDEGKGGFILIAGERRWRAATMAGLATLTCIVSDQPLSSTELLIDQVTENLLREDLRPVERAKAFRTLMDANGWSVRQVAQELSVSPGAVTQALALLELPEGLQAQVEEGSLAPTVAYELSKVEDAAEQATLAEGAIAGRFTRDEVKERVRQGGSGKGRGGARKGAGSKAAKRKPTTTTARASNGAKVTVEHRKGVDDALVAEALEEILATVRGRLAGADAA